MSQSPDWKRDTGFVAELIERQKMGPYADCQEPLEFDVATGPLQDAYGMALGIYGAKLIGSDWNQVDPDRDVEADLTHCYVDEDTARQISYDAFRDIQELRNL